jgi:hypothetical protein
MLPAQSNKDMADWTMQGLHNILPKYFGLGNYFGRLTVCLLEDRVRIAMMYVVPILFQTEFSNLRV